MVIRKMKMRIRMITISVDHDFFLLQDDKELLEYIQGYSGDLSKLDYRKVYDRCDVSLVVDNYFSSEIIFQCICIWLQSFLSLVCMFFSGSL